MLENYILILDAITKLLHPLVEAVIHDVDENKISYICGCLSRRKIGDESLLDIDLDSTTIKDIVYSKLNFDGKLVKSISVPITSNGKRYLVCINCDISIFEQVKTISTLMLEGINQQPEKLFTNDWQERVNVELHKFIKCNNLDFNHLNNKQKKDILYYFYKNGAFDEKKAPDYLAKVLSMGRATIFKYLKEWRSSNEVV